ncbi:MAG: hypothetical protein ACJ76S_00700 [Solirubrobacteraceae bacterium]
MDLDPRVAAGMREQLRAWRAQLDAGAERVGWKIGLNAPSLQRELGLASSVVGHLTTATLVRAGEGHSVAGGTNLGVEPEIAIEVGEAVPGDAGPDAARDAIARLAPALEVVDVDRPFEDVQTIVADNVFHRAFALGEPAGSSLGDAEATFLVNGAAVHRLDVSQAAGDLVEAVAVIARTLAACGERLEARDRIIAGALAPAVPVAAGDSVALDLGPLGRVDLRFGA